MICEMRLRIWWRPLFLTLILLLGVVFISASRTIDRLYIAEISVIDDNGTVRGATVLGEFSSLCADYVNLVAHHYWHTGRWYAVPAFYELIVRLEPYHTTYWSLLGWYYAFNMSAYAESKETQLAFYKKGVQTLIRGLQYHPSRYDLYFDIAWIYYLKEKQYEKALYYSQRAMLCTPPPSAVKLHTLILVKCGQVRQAIDVWRTYVKKHPESEYAQREYKKIKDIQTKS